jgi:type VI secretion system protein VasJ
MPENTDTEVSTVPQIPEIVQKYLDPIAGDSATGKDAANEEEYFLLNMEMPKTKPDYQKCIELADVILREKSKDVKVASWLCFALFRTEKIQGLKDGLNIIYQLLNKYENNLFPENTIHRSKAIQFINADRFYKLVEREQINKSNAKDVIEADEILNQIIELNKKLFPENTPVLKSILEVLKNHVEKANSLLTSPKPAEQVKKETPENKEAASKPPGVERPRPQTPSPPVSAAPSDIKISNEKDAIVQLRKILGFFFETNQDGTQKEKVPETTSVFGITRQLQWGNIFRPADTDKVTQIEAPNQIIQGKMKEWFSSNNWDTLIPRVELSFLKPNSEYPYWLDLQRYVAKALEQKGGVYAQAAEDIKIQLAKLLLRFPDFHQLKFKDKNTPFADVETIKWINDEVKSSLSGGKGSESIILPPIMGEDFNPINKEYEAFVKELPNKFEENVLKLQDGIKTDTRIKGKFLRRLNLANYCYEAKQYNLAKINLIELKKLIDDYNIIEWESALCTSVWQSLYLTNLKLIEESQDKDSKQSIQQEQKELFSKIAKYDGILAIKISQKK